MSYITDVIPWRLSTAATKPQTVRLHTSPEVSRLEELAFKYGRSYDAYISTDTEGKEYYFTPQSDGAVCLVRKHRHMFAFGGLLAHESKWNKIVTQLMGHCGSKGHSLSFFNVGEQEATLLRTHGFQVTKFGEEPVIHVDERDWKGKSYEWVRRQRNNCQRNAISFEEIVRDQVSAEEWSDLMIELQHISNDFLQEKAHGKGLRNIISRFSPDLLFRQRIFVARNPARQRIEAFAICNPCVDGQMWAVESYRKRSDAVSGVIAFLVQQIVDQFKSEGIPRLSLCMLPLIRCETPTPGDSWLLRQSVVMSYKYLNCFYDAKGLYHFKTRFRPDHFENRYFCSWPRTSLSLLLSAVHSWGGFQIAPLRATRKLANQQFHSSKQRANLALPKAA